MDEKVKDLTGNYGKPLDVANFLHVGSSCIIQNRKC